MNAIYCDKVNNTHLSNVTIYKVKSYPYSLVNLNSKKILAENIFISHNSIEEKIEQAASFKVLVSDKILIKNSQFSNNEISTNY